MQTMFFIFSVKPEVWRKTKFYGEKRSDGEGEGEERGERGGKGDGGVFHSHIVQEETDVSKK